MKRLLAIAATAAFTAISTCGMAAATELKMSAWIASGHPFVAGMLVPWAKEVEKETGGSLKLTLLPQPVASPVAHFDAIRDGLADITLISVTYYGDQLGLLQVGMQPLQADTAEARSVALQRLYDKFLADKMADTAFQGVKVLGHWATGPGIIWTSKKAVTSPESIKGLQIRIGGSVALQMGEALGATAVVKPGTETYELMSGGIIDGVFFPKEAICGFKLNDLIGHATMFPGGLYADFQTLIINEDSYNSLTKAEQDAVMKYSGEFVSRMGGRANDAADKACWDQLKTSSMKIIEASPEFTAFAQSKVDPHITAWKDKMSAAGLDGEAAWDYYREQLSDLNASIRP